MPQLDKKQGVERSAGQDAGRPASLVGEAGANRAVSRRVSSVVSFAVSFLVAVGSIAAGAVIGGKAYVVVSAIVVLCSLVPFFVQFERRPPQAREVVLVAVMCALAVVARAAFVWVPHFKPMAAIVMVAGMGLGASSGFLVGSVSVLASNFIFGQGPWTPWQMLSFGLCGFVFGLLADKGVFPRGGLGWKRRIALALSGGLFVVLIAGPVLDTSSLFYLFSGITPETVFAVYAAGFPVNCIHGAATFATLLLVANPLLSQLARVRKKYGLGTTGT